MEISSKSSVFNLQISISHLRSTIDAAEFWLTQAKETLYRYQEELDQLHDMELEKFLGHKVLPNNLASV